MRPNKEKYDKAYIDYDSYYHSHNYLRSKLSNEHLLEGYLALSLFFQGIFISKDGYIIDTGNFETVNLVLMERVRKRIEKHPLLWKLFFLIL